MRPLIAAATIAAMLVPGSGLAQERISMIRDAEIENTIRAYATPVFTAAGLAPGDVRIHLVRDDRLNAFVADGLNLFLNTGLIRRTETPGQLIGVIAHETGHIAGGHLVRLRDELRNASTQALITMILGMAAAVAAGEGGVGAMVSGAGHEAAMRSLMSYSRAQEASADQAGLRFLEQTEQSARGYVEFLEIVADQELLAAARQDPYLRTHPITQERVAAARAHLARSRYNDVPPSPEFAAMHARMRAKLDGFLLPPHATLERYPAKDTSVPARYARAIAYYRIPDLGRALPLIDDLIAEHPEDPYFHELRGQMLFENGRLQDALPSYEKAARLLPQSALLRMELARVSIETQDPARTKEAVRQLDEVTRIEPQNAGAWRLLGIAYGRDGQIGRASLALAESALLRDKHEEARMHADRAMRTFPKGSPDWLRADDIKRTAANKDE